MPVTQVMPDVGRVVDEFVVMAYCTDCPVADASVTVFTVMEVCVGGVPVLAVGVVTPAPSPTATALAEMVPDTATADDAPCTLPCGMLEGRVMVTAFVFAVVGAPEILTVTTVPLVRAAGAATSPAGSPDTAKLDAVMDPV